MTTKSNITGTGAEYCRNLVTFRKNLQEQVKTGGLSPALIELRFLNYKRFLKSTKYN